MKIGDKVTFKGRTGKIVAFMPGDMVDVQFEDVSHVERRAKNLLTLAGAKSAGAKTNPSQAWRNPRERRKPRYVRARTARTRRNPEEERSWLERQEALWSEGVVITLPKYQRFPPNVVTLFLKVLDMPEVSGLSDVASTFQAVLAQAEPDLQVRAVTPVPGDRDREPAIVLTVREDGVDRSYRLTSGLKPPIARDEQPFLSALDVLFQAEVEAAQQLATPPKYLKWKVADRKEKIDGQERMFQVHSFRRATPEEIADLVRKEREAQDLVRIKQEQEEAFRLSVAKSAVKAKASPIAAIYSFLLDEIFSPLTEAEEARFDEELIAFEPQAGGFFEGLTEKTGKRGRDSTASAASWSAQLKMLRSGEAMIRGKSEGKAASAAAAQEQVSKSTKQDIVKTFVVPRQLGAPLEKETKLARWTTILKAATRSKLLNDNEFRRAWNEAQRRVRLLLIDTGEGYRRTIDRLCRRLAIRMQYYRDGNYHPSDIAKLDAREQTYPKSLPRLELNQFSEATQFFYDLFKKREELLKVVRLTDWFATAPFSFKDIQGDLSDAAFIDRLIAYSESEANPLDFFKGNLESEASQKLLTMFNKIELFYPLYVSCLGPASVVLTEQEEPTLDEILVFLEAAAESPRNLVSLSYDLIQVRQGRVGAYAQDLAPTLGICDVSLLNALQQRLAANRNVFAQAAAQGLLYEAFEQKLNPADPMAGPLRTLLRASRSLVAGYRVYQNLQASVSSKELAEVEQITLVTPTLTGTAKREVRTKRPSYYRKRDIVTREPKSAIAEIMRKNRASYFTRNDPLRASGPISVCGNPVDGTAYYIVVNSAPQKYSRYLTWENVQKNLSYGARNASLRVVTRGALPVLRSLRVPISYEERPLNRDEWMARRWPSEMLTYGLMVNENNAYPQWRLAYDLPGAEDTRALRLTEEGKEMVAGSEPAIIKRLSSVALDAVRQLMGFFRAARVDEMGLTAFYTELEKRHPVKWIRSTLEEAKNYRLIEEVDYSGDVLVELTAEGKAGISDGRYKVDQTDFLLSFPPGQTKKSELKEYYKARGMSENTFNQLFRLCTLLGALAQTEITYSVMERSGRKIYIPKTRLVEAVPVDVDPLGRVYRDIERSGEPQVELVSKEYQRLYLLHDIAYAWGLQDDLQGELRPETLQVLLPYEEISVIARKFAADSYALEQRAKNFKKVMTLDKNRVGTYDRVLHTTDTNVTAEVWNPTSKVPDALKQLAELYSTGVLLNTQLKGPFNTAEAGDIFAPLRRAFETFKLSGLFQQNLKEYENALRLKRTERQQSTNNVDDVVRIPRIDRKLSQETIDKVLDACLMRGESKAYPVTRLAVEEDERGRGRGLDADPLEHFHIIENGRPVFFKAERLVFPGFDFVTSLNPYAFREFRVVRSGTDTVDIIVESAKEAGVALSPSLVQAYLVGGNVSIDSNKPDTETYEPIEYINSESERLEKDTTVRIWQRHKDRSPFFTWQKVEGPESLVDAQIPTPDAIVPCVDRVEQGVVRSLGTFKEILYNIRGMYSYIQSVINNAVRGEGGKTTGSEQQLDELCRKFLSSLEFFVTYRSQLKDRKTDGETVADREAAGRALELIDATIAQFKLDKIFNFALDAPNYASGRYRVDVKEQQERVQSFRRRRQARQRNADMGATRVNDPTNQIIPLQEYILVNTAIRYRPEYQQELNIRFPDPVKDLKELPIVDESSTMAYETGNFLARMILRAFSSERPIVPSERGYLQLLDLTYGAVAWPFDDKGQLKPPQHPMVGSLPFVASSFDHNRIMGRLEKDPTYSEQFEEESKKLSLSRPELVAPFVELLNAGITIPTPYVVNPAIFLRFRNSEFETAIPLAKKLASLGFRLYADLEVREPRDETPSRTPSSPIYKQIERPISAQAFERNGVACAGMTLPEYGSAVAAHKIQVIIDTSPYLPAFSAETPLFRGLMDVRRWFENSIDPEIQEAVRNNGYFRAARIEQPVMSQHTGRIGSGTGTWDFRKDAIFPGSTPEVEAGAMEFIGKLNNFASYYEGELLYSIVGENYELYGDLGTRLDVKERSTLMESLGARPGDFVVLVFTPVDPAVFRTIPMITNIDEAVKFIRVKEGLRYIDTLLIEFVTNLEKKLKRDAVKKRVNDYKQLKSLFQQRDVLANQVRLLMLGGGAPFTVWVSTDEPRRYFYLPNDLSLPAGSYRIRNMAGEVKDVNGVRLSTFAIDEARANEILRGVQAVSELPDLKIRKYVENWSSPSFAKRVTQRKMSKNATVIDRVYRHAGKLIRSPIIGNALLSSESKTFDDARDLLHFFGKLSYGDTKDLLTSSSVVRKHLEQLVSGLVLDIPEKKPGELLRRVGEKSGSLRATLGERVGKALAQKEEQVVETSSPLEYRRARPGEAPQIQDEHALSYPFYFIPPRVWYASYDMFTDPAKEIKAQTPLAIFRQLDENQTLYSILDQAILDYQRKTSTVDRREAALKWLRIFIMAEMYYYFDGYEAFGAMAKEGQRRVETDAVRQQKQAFDGLEKNIEKAIQKINFWMAQSNLGPGLRKKAEYLNQKTTEYWQDQADSYVPIVEDAVNPYKDMSGQIYSGPARSKDLSDYIRRTDNLDVSRGEIAAILKAEQTALSGGSLRKTGSVAVFKTYNPVLFELTRAYYPSIIIGQNPFLLSYDAVRAVDYAGMYGSVLTLSSESALWLRTDRMDNPDALMSYNLGERPAADDMDIFALFEDRQRFLNCYIRNEHYEPRSSSTEAQTGMFFQKRKKASFGEFKYFGELWPIDVPFGAIDQFWYNHFFALRGEEKPAILQNVTRLREAFEQYARRVQNWVDSDLLSNLKRILARVSTTDHKIDSRSERITPERRWLRNGLSYIYSAAKINEDESTIVYAWNREALLYDWAHYDPAGTGEQQKFEDYLAFWGRFKAFDMAAVLAKAVEPKLFDAAEVIHFSPDDLEASMRATAQSYQAEPYLYTPAVIQRLITSLQKQWPTLDSEGLARAQIAGRMPSFAASQNEDEQVFETSTWRRMMSQRQVRTEEMTKVADVLRTVLPTLSEAERKRVDAEVAAMKDEYRSMYQEQYRSDTASRDAVKSAWDASLVSDYDPNNQGVFGEDATPETRSEVKMNPRKKRRQRPPRGSRR